jgi:hypothetical protein
MFRYGGGDRQLFALPRMSHGQMPALPTPHKIQGDQKAYVHLMIISFIISGTTAGYGLLVHEVS